MVCGGTGVCGRILAGEIAGEFGDSVFCPQFPCSPPRPFLRRQESHSVVPATIGKNPPTIPRPQVVHSCEGRNLTIKCGNAAIESAAFADSDDSDGCSNDSERHSVWTEGLSVLSLATPTTRTATPYRRNPTPCGRSNHPNHRSNHPNHRSNYPNHRNRHPTRRNVVNSEVSHQNFTVILPC